MQPTGWDVDLESGRRSENGSTSGSAVVRAVTGLNSLRKAGAKEEDGKGYLEQAEQFLSTAGAWTNAVAGVAKIPDLQTAAGAVSVAANFAPIAEAAVKGYRTGTVDHPVKLAGQTISATAAAAQLAVSKTIGEDSIAAQSLGLVNLAGTTIADAADDKDHVAKKLYHDARSWWTGQPATPADRSAASSVREARPPESPARGRHSAAVPEGRAATSSGAQAVPSPEGRVPEPVSRGRHAAPAPAERPAEPAPSRAAASSPGRGAVTPSAAVPAAGGLAAAASLASPAAASTGGNRASGGASNTRAYSQPAPVRRASTR